MEQVHFRKLQLEFGFEKKSSLLWKFMRYKKKSLDFTEF